MILSCRVRGKSIIVWLLYLTSRNWCKFRGVLPFLTSSRIADLWITVFTFYVTIVHSMITQWQRKRIYRVTESVTRLSVPKKHSTQSNICLCLITQTTTDLAVIINWYFDLFWSLVFNNKFVILLYSNGTAVLQCHWTMCVLYFLCAMNMFELLTASCTGSRKFRWGFVRSPDC